VLICVCRPAECYELLTINDDITLDDSVNLCQARFTLGWKSTEWTQR